MDGQRFDSIARGLAIGTSRRRLLKGVAATVLGGVISRLATHPVAAVRRPGRAICAPPDSCCDLHPCNCCIPFHFDCPSWCAGVAGVVGAGSVRTTTGLVQISLFAGYLTDVNTPGGPESMQPVARVQWVDPSAALTLESIGADYVGPLEGVEGGREVIGWLRMNGAGEYPFILQAIAAEPWGAGPEIVRLRVGDAVLNDPVAAGLRPTGFTYTAGGELVSGDLQLLSFGPIRPVAVAPAAMPAA